MQTRSHKPQSDKASPPTIQKVATAGGIWAPFPQASAGLLEPAEAHPGRYCHQARSLKFWSVDAPDPRRYAANESASLAA